AHLRRQPIRLVQRSDRVLSRVRPAGAGAGHRLDRAPAVRRGAARLLDARRCRRRNRSHQRRLRSPCAPRPRDRAGTLRCPRGAAAPAGRRLLMKIAHIAPVATTIPPPKSGSVETMTSLLTEGLVGRGHDVTLFATADSQTSARLNAIYPHGYWHDEHMWPWELYEMLNLACAVERADDYDVIHYEAAYYPMSLPFGRLSPTPIAPTLHHPPSAAQSTPSTPYP